MDVQPTATPTGIQAQRGAIIAEFLSTVERIPALPAVYHEVRALAASRDVDAWNIARRMEKDPALSGRVLKLANSAIYGFRGKITSLHLAVSLLGNNNIFALVSSLVVLRQFRRPPGGKFDPAQFWEHGMLAGACAVELNGHYGYGIHEDIFTFGLLHDIGKIVVYEHLPRQFEQVIELHVQGMPYRKAEEQILGADHTVLGGVVAEHWKLPADYVACIRGHHVFNGRAETLPERRMFLVFLGNILAHMAEARRAKGAYPQMKKEFLDRFRIGQGQVEALADRARKATESVKGYLKW